MSSTLDKRTRQDLEDRVWSTKARLSRAEEKVQPSTGHSPQYWTSAAAACVALVQNLHAEAELAMRDWKPDESEEPAESWWSTFEARRIIEQILAARLEKELFTRQAEGIIHGHPIPRNIEALFTASQVGICQDKLNIKCRQVSEQLRFKKVLLEFYAEAKRPLGWSYDTATGFTVQHSEKIHLFPYSLDPEISVALFGEEVKDDLMSAQNGLLLIRPLRTALHDGVIAIVPDLPENPTPEQVATWQQEEPKNCRWRVIDEDADCLDQCLLTTKCHTKLTEDLRLQDFDHRRLVFGNENRPQARYIFFTSVVSQLRMAWRHQYQHDPAEKELKSRLGKGFWLTAGNISTRPFFAPFPSK